MRNLNTLPHIARTLYFRLYSTLRYAFTELVLHWLDKSKEAGVDCGFGKGGGDRCEASQTAAEICETKKKIEQLSIYEKLYALNNDSYVIFKYKEKTKFS